MPLKTFRYLAAVTLCVAVFQLKHETRIEGLLIAIFFLVMGLAFKEEKK